MVAAAVSTALLVAGCTSSSHPAAADRNDESGAMACDGYAHNHNLVYGGGGYASFVTVREVRARATRMHRPASVRNLSALPASTRVTSCDLFDKSRPQGPPAKIVWLTAAGVTYADELDAALTQTTPSPGGA